MSEDWFNLTGRVVHAPRWHQRIRAAWSMLVYGHMYVPPHLLFSADDWRSRGGK